MIGYRWSGGTGKREWERETGGEKDVGQLVKLRTRFYSLLTASVSRQDSQRTRCLFSVSKAPLQLTRGSNTISNDREPVWDTVRLCVWFSLPCVAVFCVLVNFFFFLEFSIRFLSRFLSRFVYIYIYYILYIYINIYIYTLAHQKTDATDQLWILSDTWPGLYLEDTLRVIIESGRIRVRDSVGIWFEGTHNSIYRVNFHSFEKTRKIGNVDRDSLRYFHLSIFF